MECNENTANTETKHIFSSKFEKRKEKLHNTYITLNMFHYQFTIHLNPVELDFVLCTINLNQDSMHQSTVPNKFIFGPINNIPP